MGLINHVLPGDATVPDFRETGIDGEVIVCREALVDGPLNAKSLDQFWKLRSEYIGNENDAAGDSYYTGVVSEFKKLLDLSAAAEINLWFEYELFCSVNMWFCLDLLHGTEIRIFRVAPVTRTPDEIWKGFGRMSANDMRKCFAGRTEFREEDRELGRALWRAYSEGDFEKLDELGNANSDCFPHLREVCTAAIEKPFRPKQILEEITAGGTTDFGEIFKEFSDGAGVYGFGDMQVKKILSAVNRKY